jgi:hypothetical protein
MPGSEREQQFLKAEHLVELRSGELKKELRLGDLVLSQVLYITGCKRPTIWRTPRALTAS